MSLGAMKKEIHDRLWKAQERWFALRAQGQTKRQLKLRGLREAGDPHLYTRNLIFTGATKRAIEDTLKGFVEFAHERFGCGRLEDVGKREVRAFIEDGIARGLSAAALRARVSHLVKLGCLAGRARSAIALGRKLHRRIRELEGEGLLRGPERATPSEDTAGRALAILRDRDLEYEARTGRPRAYHLAARLQLETAARSVSVTDRLTLDCLKGSGVIEIVGKGGRRVAVPVAADLYGAVEAHLRRAGEPLADRDGYRMAWRRAVQAAGGRVRGTHGLRRRSAQDFYARAYARHLGS